MVLTSPSSNTEYLYVTGFTGILIDHVKQSKLDKRPSAAGYKPNCVLLLPRTVNNNSDKCVDQNPNAAPLDTEAREIKKTSGGVRKAILNKRQNETDTVHLKPRRRKIVARKPLPKTPLNLKLASYPDSSMGCTLEYYLAHFNMFRDSEDARRTISDFLRGGPESRRKDPRESSYRNIYGQLYESHLEHVKKKILKDGEGGGRAGGVGKKTSLHIHQNCSCASHDVTAE